MSSTRIAQIRNVGIVAHINAGKTTLSERILFDTGAQRFMGEVDDGTAAMDFLTEEQRRGISISAAVTRVDWKGHRLHLIDTPGHVDFTAEVERCLRVLDGVIVLIDGVRGVESQTETVWRQAEQRAIPRLLFVNKLDRPGASMAGALASVRERLRARVVPIGWPVFGEAADGATAFRGILDLVRRAVQRFDAEDPALAAQPLPMPAELADLRGEVLEAGADFDDEIMAAVVEERAVDTAALIGALRRGTLANRLVPMLPGSALFNRGVDLLLDAVAMFLPSPLDSPPVTGVGTDESRSARIEDPVSALVFKRLREGDAWMFCVRVYSGVLLTGMTIAVSGRTSGLVTLSEISVVRAGEHEVIDRAGPGEVVAVRVRHAEGGDGGPRLRTGDTLHAVDRPIVFESVEFPDPVLAVRLEPTGEQDLESVQHAAEELVDEDPTLRFVRGRAGEDDATEMRVEGMGELHLEVFASRLRRRVGDAVRIGQPRVHRRVTIAGGGRAEAECRSPQDPAQWARVELELEPASDPEAEPEVWRASSAGDAGGSGRVEEVALAEFRALVTHGLGAHPSRGVRGYLRRVEVPVDDELHRLLVQEAVAVALRKAAAEAVLVVLEPFAEVVVRCPKDCKSSVLADLRSRDASVRGVSEDLDRARIEGRVPLAETLGYPTALRSMTRGLGDVELRPDGFSPRDS